ncbi:hypothetical protein Tco_1030127 [Tanacetum coccineum]|uniref:Integrase, catalytic region, zinc finger, CCHC-type, peptidase aspartic, catalytic n=1 Tax=Tanacetum coccineum TaxID=301880 RepID=A0ABQ5G5W9_9ASTR
MLKYSIKNGPFQLKPEITAKDTDGVTDIRRAQKVEDLFAQEKLRYDSDIKAVNILLLGLPVDIYTLINHYQTAKEIWDHVKELMKGTKMTKQERESMLYDEFNKFTSEPRESIHSYYLRYAKLINDIKMIPMSMSNMQINTKFVNHLQPEWSRFVTVATQARDLHSVNFDKLYAFLKHIEKYAKEVREMRQRFPEPLALLANTYNTPPLYNSQQIHYAPIVVQQPPTLQPDTGFVVPTFLPTDDPIASLNKAIVGSTDLMITKLHKICIEKSKICIEYQLLCFLNTLAQEAEIVLNDEQHDFLADSLEETDDCEDLQLQATSNFKADHVDGYDSNCDDEATTNAIFMANLSPVGSINDDTVKPRYDSDILSEFSEPQLNQNGTSVNTKLSKPPTSRNKIYAVTPLPKSKVTPKVVEKNNLSKSVNSHLTTNQIIEKCTKVLAPGLLKIEFEPINAYFKNNRAVHRDYLKVTKEHVATLHELLEEAKALKPLDEHIGHASKFAERI